MNGAHITSLQWSRLAACTATGLVFLAILCYATGCAVASVALPLAAGVSSTAYGEYRGGEYVDAVEASRRACELAVWESCKHFGLTMHDWEADAGATTAKLGNVRGDSFRIRIAYVGPTRTALYIRAGLWGDDLCSRQLACDIEAAALRIERALHAPRAR